MSSFVLRKPILPRENRRLYIGQGHYKLLQDFWCNATKVLVKELVLVQEDKGSRRLSCCFAPLSHLDRQHCQLCTRRCCWPSSKSIPEGVAGEEVDALSQCQSLDLRPIQSFPLARIVTDWRELKCPTALRCK